MIAHDVWLSQLFDAGEAAAAQLPPGESYDGRFGRPRNVRAVYGWAGAKAYSRAMFNLNRAGAKAAFLRDHPEPGFWDLLPWHLPPSALADAAPLPRHDAERRVRAARLNGRYITGF